MANIKQLDNMKILSYSDVITSMVSNLDFFGKKVTDAFVQNRISEEEMQKLHELMANKISFLEDARIPLAKEMNRRIKHDLKIPHGPSDIDTLLTNLVQKNPTVMMDDLQYENYTKNLSKKVEGSKGKGKKEVIRLDKK